MTDKQNLPWQLEELRDKFAMAAMQGDWSAQDGEVGYYVDNIPDDGLIKRAELYYRMADAMLKVRG
ncbi:hypothetical protein J9236_00170 [Providencia rettgeri]|uniref:hypothetical protein n=1 Tax=Providencia rettgeri TaxID=587 RepID=UPI001B366F78|nr:hypothetical protein [Providencia rettgeri]MBQ0339655.1 hypothetical protein [Providencia rettgeri]